MHVIDWEIALLDRIYTLFDIHCELLLCAMHAIINDTIVIVAHFQPHTATQPSPMGSPSETVRKHVPTVGCAHVLCRGPCGVLQHAHFGDDGEGVAKGVEHLACVPRKAS